MLRSTFLLAGWGIAATIANPVAAPAPQVTQAAKIEERAASCTFSGANGAASASKSKTSCATIVLSNVAVPSGTTLDLTKLNDNTHVPSLSHH